MNKKKFFKYIYIISIICILLVIINGCNSKKFHKNTQHNITSLQKSFSNANNISTSFDNKYFYVHSNGIAISHPMMIGIKNWHQQVPTPQDYTGNNAWPIPLHPKMSKKSLSLAQNLMEGAVAIAINGVPIFNPLNNRGDDIYLLGELDNHGGHSGQGDDYHYHIVPLSLQSLNPNGPIAYALDGYPLYGLHERDGTPHRKLDENNGHTDNIDGYHYHASSTYPYIMANMVGKITLSNTKSKKNKIIPQPKVHPFRAHLTPLNNALITNFKMVNSNNYILTYYISSEITDEHKTNNTYQIDYSWDNSLSIYTFKFIKNTYVKQVHTYIKGLPPQHTAHLKK